MAQVRTYAVVRSASRVPRRHRRGSDKVTWTGTIALDLPAGVAAVGGRGNLTAKLAYQLARGPQDALRQANADNRDARLT